MFSNKRVCDERNVIVSRSFLKKEDAVNIDRIQMIEIIYRVLGTIMNRRGLVLLNVQVNNTSLSKS